MLGALYMPVVCLKILQSDNLVGHQNAMFMQDRQHI